MSMGIRDTKRYAKEMIIDYVDTKIKEQIKYHLETYTELLAIISERNAIARRYALPEIDYKTFAETAAQEGR